MTNVLDRLRTDEKFRRRFKVTAINQRRRRIRMNSGNDDLLFSASLRTSIRPEVCQDATTVTYSRSTTAYVKDNSGDYKLAAINEARFRGARRISEGVYSDLDSNGSGISNSTLWGYLSEQASTNEIRNNSMQGAVVGVIGSGGALPTNWREGTSGTSGWSDSGLTCEIIGVGTENDIDYIELKVSGTPSNSNVRNLEFEQTTQVAAVAAEVWTQSEFIKLQDGTLTNMTVRRDTIERDGAGAVLVTSAGATFTPTSAALGTQRGQKVRTLTDASTAYISSRLVLDVTSGQAVNATFRIGWPQIEEANLATSPIRTTTTAVARTADSLTYTSAGNANEVQGTLYCEAISEFLRGPSSGAVRSAASIARATATNFEITAQFQRSAAATSTVTVVSTSTQAAIISSGAPTASTLRRLAIAWALNNTNGAFDGAIGTNDTVCTMATSLTTIYVGLDDAGNALNGCTKNLRIYGPRLSDAALAALQ